METAPNPASVLLEVNQLEVVYGDVVRAVQGVSLRVYDNSIVAVIGLNGAGKTTTLRGISGFLPSERAAITHGTITFAGSEIGGLRPDEISKRGIGIVSERDKIFPTLSVRENLNVSAVTASSGGAGAVSSDTIFDVFPSLAKHQDTTAVFLSGGERQLLAVATALLGQPKLLLVDEMSLGLSPKIQSLVLGKLLELHKSLGISLLLVDQNAETLLKVADYGYVMENGMVVRDGSAKDLMEHADVREFYMGLGKEGREGKRVSYRDIKQYKRIRRWWG